MLSFYFEIPLIKGGNISEGKLGEQNYIPLLLTVYTALLSNTWVFLIFILLAYYFQFRSYTSICTTFIYRYFHPI
jgi:hypothetical protein